MTLPMWSHHDSSAIYVSTDAPELGESVTVFLRASADVRGVVVRSTPDGEPTYVDAVIDSRAGARTGGAGAAGFGIGAGARAGIGERWWRAEVRVRNPVTGYRFLVTGPAGHHWVNSLGAAAHDVPDCYDFRLVAHEPPPVWTSDAVIYQVFPDRFARSSAAAHRPRPDWAVECDWDTPVIGRGPDTPHQFYGGDLDGVTEHLDHIMALGANTVYLTPIFPARSNHRYNASAFDAVDPLLGGSPALERLTAGIRARGMRLVGDLTTNHCGDDHPWFAAALAGGAEREMFYFDPDGDYESWLGVKTLPKLNWGSGELRRRFVAGPDAVIPRWLSYFDGWRVDVANMTGRRGADNYTHEVARLLRSAATTARKDALVVGEHGHDFTGDLDRDGWQGTMNYAGFTRPIWSWLRADTLDLPDFLGVPGGVPHRTGGQAVATMRAFGGLVSWRSLASSWTILSSHDTARIRTVVGSAARVEVAAGLMVTMPGVPMIFAGDELGLTGENGEGSRVPMPWHRPATWDHATLTRYRALISLRAAHPALREGGLRWLYVGDNALAFLRESPDETLLVYARRAAGNPVALPWHRPGGRGPVVGSASSSTLGGRVGDNVYGGADLISVDSSVVLPGDGPTFQVWRMP